MAGTRIAPKQQRSRETVTKILDASDELFAEFGVHDTQITQIIERSGVFAGSLYRFFPDKMSIAEALVERYRESMNVVTDAVPAAATVDEVLVLIDLAVDLTADHQEKNPGFRALAEVFSPADPKSPLYEIRQAQIDLVLGLCATVADHLDPLEFRRTVSYQAEIINALLNAEGLDDDRSLRVAEIKRVVRGYVLEVLGEKPLGRD